MSTQRHGARLSTTSCPAQPTAAVLVFHGGAADSTAPVSRFSPAVLRLIPVARAIARAEPSVAVYRLRFGVRGWNGLGTDVLADAHQALADIAGRQPGLPIVVVGHSLGGRVAMAVAGTQVTPDSRVVGAVGLAPWVEESDPVTFLDGIGLAIVQGTHDKVVPEPSTRRWLAKARAAGAIVTSTIIEGGGHTMLRYLRQWHALTVDGVRSVLATARDQQDRRQQTVRSPAEPPNART